MLYLFQVTIYSALLYSVYIQVLKNRASHSWNRIYLLLCAILPLIVPFITIPELSARIPVTNSTLNILLPEITVFTKNNPGLSSIYHWSYIALAAYLLITAAILLRTIIQYTAFIRFAKQCRYEVVNNVKVLLDTKTGPGSFQNYIFLPGNEIDPAILEHEQAHIRLKHSSDILLLRVLQAIFWPNIVLYAITRELKIVHEFQADAAAVKNKEVYITTLLNDTFSTSRFSLSHTFFYHPLKRRIMMLQKSPLSRTKLRIAMLKTGFSAVILLSGVIYLQSCKQSNDLKQNTGSQTNSSFDTAKNTALLHQARIMMKEYERLGHEYQANEKTMSDAVKEVKMKELQDLQDRIESAMKQVQPPNTPINEVRDTIINGRKIYPYVEKMPGTPYDLTKYLQANLKYPEATRKKGISGRVIVRFTIDENGNVLDPIIIRGVDPGLDAEALRVVSAMPKWTPGEKDGKNVAVFFTLPISFQMN